MRRFCAALMACMAFALGASACAAQNVTGDYMRRTYGHIPPASACPTLEFYMEFQPGQSEPIGAIPASFEANIDTAKRCNVLTVFVAGHDPAQIEVVRQLLLGEGLTAQAIQTYDFDVPIAPPPYTTDQVRVTFYFRA